MISSPSERRERKKEEQKMKKRRRNVIIVMVEAILCMVLCITCYGVSILNSYNYEELDPSVYKETTTQSHKKPTKVTQVVEVTNEEKEVIGTSVEEIEVDTNLTGYRNILVVGLDARSQFSFDDGVQSDVMIIVSINNATGDIKMVSILRDCILRQESGKAYDKANAQFCTSGISDTVSMVNRNLGLDIDEYVIVNWFGVATCINQLGGVEITIPNSTILSYFNAYLTTVNENTGIWAPQLSAPGTYNMSGTQAVAFCRIRYGGYNDTGRTANQREVIEKMLAKAKGMAASGDLTGVLNVAQTGLSNVRTNLTLPEILYTAAEVGDYNIAGSAQFPINYKSGQYLGNYPGKYAVLDPLVATDFVQEVKMLHQFLFDDDYYEPSQFVHEVSYQMYLDANGM